MPAINLQSGLPLLASWKTSVSTQTSTVLTIPACEMLQVQFNITGYTGTAIASLRFNGDTTIGNYNSAYTGGTSTTLTTVLGTIGMFKLGMNAVTNQRSGLVTIYNYSGTAHPLTCQSITQSAGTSAPVLSIGGGNWNSAATTQITSIQMVVDTSASVTAGSSFAVFGMNP